MSFPSSVVVIGAREKWVTGVGESDSINIVSYEAYHKVSLTSNQRQTRPNSPLETPLKHQRKNRRNIQTRPKLDSDRVSVCTGYDILFVLHNIFYCSTIFLFAKSDEGIMRM